MRAPFWGPTQRAAIGERRTLREGYYYRVTKVSISPLLWVYALPDGWGPLTSLRASIEDARGRTHPFALVRMGASASHGQPSPVARPLEVVESGRPTAAQRWKKLRHIANLFKPSTSEAQLRGYAAFVPRIVLQNIISGEGVGAIPPGALASEDAGPGGAATQELTAAVLFVDVVGFTKLTTGLAAQSRTAGFDHLNRLWGAVIDTCNAWGGDCISFMGDAMLAVFPIGQEHTEQQAARRAIDAAKKAMQPHT